LNLWKRQTYKTLLQSLISKTHNEKIRIKIPSDAHLGTFSNYLDIVERSTNIKIERDLKVGTDFQYMQVFRKVAFVSVIKAVMGPVIESCILIDRYLSLLEKGYNTKLINLFDYDKSPRNMAIIVSKDVL
jgi:hypothetical protein